MASKHCLERGGADDAPKHFRTMLACAELCHTAVYVMMLKESIRTTTSYVSSSRGYATTAPKAVERWMEWRNV